VGIGNVLRCFLKDFGANAISLKHSTKKLRGAFNSRDTTNVEAQIEIGDTSKYPIRILIY